MLIECLLVCFVSLNLVLYLISLLSARRKEKKVEPEVYCILIAHPDDEVMFFGPTILGLVKQGHEVHVLCLSNGNYYGLGVTRETELRNSCRKMSSEIIVEIKTDFEDHPTLDWDTDKLERTITSYVRTNDINKVLTFDKDGISSHVNHRSLHKVIPKLKRKNPGLVVYTLKTCSLVRKYLFVNDLAWTLFVEFKLGTKRESVLFISSLSDYLVNVKAMLEHKSQLLWFRYIYILSSRYMLFNYLDLVQ